MTRGGLLPARHVIHTVGPIWGRVGAEEAVELLATCYRNSLDLAVDNELATVAFPNISTGVYGFPLRLAAETATTAVTRWVSAHPDQLASVTFACFEEANHQLYLDHLE
jgi:O-acetyl-ADP-ribose deacetylase (regulator of RNase III)